jgi:hypothetical protein
MGDFGLFMRGNSYGSVIPMTEAELQKSIVNYLRLQENLGLVTFTAVTNNVPRGGEIAMRQQKKFKSLGLRPGFPARLGK